jgi:hypothetical protein
MSQTDFLFARPSFVEGMARVLDLGCTLNVYNESRTESQADYKAIRNDFRMIGQDIAFALKQNEQEETLQKK